MQRILILLIAVCSGSRTVWPAPLMTKHKREAVSMMKLREILGSIEKKYLVDLLIDAAEKISDLPTEYPSAKTPAKSAHAEGQAETSPLQATSTTSKGKVKKPKPLKPLSAALSQSQHLSSLIDQSIKPQSSKTEQFVEYRPDTTEKQKEPTHTTEGQEATPPLVGTSTNAKEEENQLPGDTSQTGQAAMPTTIGKTQSVNEPSTPFGTSEAVKVTPSEISRRSKDKSVVLPPLVSPSNEGEDVSTWRSSKNPICIERLYQPKFKDVKSIRSQKDAIEYLIYRLCLPTVTSKDISAISTIVQQMVSLGNTWSLASNRLPKVRTDILGQLPDQTVTEPSGIFPTATQTRNEGEASTSPQSVDQQTTPVSSGSTERVTNENPKITSSAQDGDRTTGPRVTSYNEGFSPTKVADQAVTVSSGNFPTATQTNKEETATSPQDVEQPTAPAASDNTDVNAKITSRVPPNNEAISTTAVADQAVTVSSAIFPTATQTANEGENGSPQDVGLQQPTTAGSNDNIESDTDENTKITSSMSAQGPDQTTAARVPSNNEAITTTEMGAKSGQGFTVTPSHPIVDAFGKFLFPSNDNDNPVTDENKVQIDDDSDTDRMTTHTNAASSQEETVTSRPTETETNHPVESSTTRSFHPIIDAIQAIHGFLTEPETEEIDEQGTNPNSETTTTTPEKPQETDRATQADTSPTNQEAAAMTTGKQTSTIAPESPSHPILDFIHGLMTKSALSDGDQTKAEDHAKIELVKKLLTALFNMDSE